MDSALLYIYCKNDNDCFRNKLYQFIEENKFNTHITFNFHNSTFDKSLLSRNDMINIYLELITDISNFNPKIKPSFFKNKSKNSIFLFSFGKRYIFAFTITLLIDRGVSNSKIDNEL